MTNILEGKHRLLANKMQQCIRYENEYVPVLFAMKMANLEFMAAASDRRQVADSTRREAPSADIVAKDLQTSTTQASESENTSSAVHLKRIFTLEKQLQATNAALAKEREEKGVLRLLHSMLLSNGSLEAQSLVVADLNRVYTGTQPFSQSRKALDLTATIRIGMRLDPFWGVRTYKYAHRWVHNYEHCARQRIK